MYLGDRRGAGCKVKIAPGSSPAASDLAHNPSVGSEAATEVNNPAAPPYSPLHTTLGMPSPARARPFKLVTRY